MSPSEEAVLKAEKHSINSKFGDGSPFDDGPGLALATIPVLHQHQAPRSKPQVWPARTPRPPPSPTVGLRTIRRCPSSGRRPSVPDSLVGRHQRIPRRLPSELAELPQRGMGGRNSALFIPVPSLSRSHSLSTSATHQTSMMGGHTGFLPGGFSQSTSSHAGLLYQTSRQTPSPQPEVNSPTSPSTPTATLADAATKQANRRSLGGTKRKPVPVYTADDEPDHAPHYLTRSQAGQDLSQPQLVHKSSFGPAGIEGKPLHYLMPDMPMPLKD
ncbi:hypothetical protein BJ912DRAFT_1058395 [Pholiota molesta]|nr:hypothetical protein BJ912DRAFT_1058395 [Pholiota molesta]